MPVDTSVPVGGRRGFYLITAAAPVVTALQRLFAYDWAPERSLDLHPFDLNHTNYGGPPADFVFPALPVYPGDRRAFSGCRYDQSDSAIYRGQRPDAGLNALLAQAGAGDEISHKLNREVVVITDMAGIYARLAEVFA